MLTFALFVGLAVLGVMLYWQIALKGQIEEAAYRSLVERAEQVVVQIERAPDASARARIAEQIATVTTLSVSLARGEEILGSWGASGTEAFHLTEEAPADGRPRPQETGSQRVEKIVDENGREWHFVTLERNGGLLVRVGYPAPPLYRVVGRVQELLIVGMVLALLFALLGAWIATRKVVDPLRTITREAKRINEGEVDQSMHVKTRAAEFQDLTRSLNKMAQRFRMDISELRRMQRVQNEFIGNVSHEVKNPIFAVFGYLEALGSESLTKAQRQKYVKKGIANLERLNNLFSDLIEIARLEYREDLIRPEAFDLQDLIEEVAEMLEPKADDKGLGLAYDNDPLYVYADRNRVRQVITNLVDNALSYTDEGSVRCRMRRHVDKARVEVVDTGRGIPSEHLDRIFERFYRVDTARSRKMGGTGLGLSIVKQILQAHGETIRVESTKGRGTRFTFELPLATEEQVREAEEEAAVGVKAV